MKTASTGILKAGLFAIALAGAGVLAASAPGFAASEGGGGSSGGSSETKCNPGWEFDSSKGICVRKKAELMDDKELYAAGRQLALDGQYEEALTLLGRIADQHDAKVLTMIGYSTRKLGNVDAGIAYYHQALAIEPDNINTREYLGEGYVSLGRMDLAQVQLDRIEKVCGTSCEQYEDLAKAMATGNAWQ
jgi:tetratricopeptide (TPR) repeat protein